MLPDFQKRQWIPAEACCNECVIISFLIVEARRKKTGRFSPCGWNTHLRAELMPSCSTGVRLRAFMSWSTTIKDKVKTNYCTFMALSTPAMQAAHNSRGGNNARLTGRSSSLCARTIVQSSGRRQFITAKRALNWLNALGEREMSPPMWLWNHSSVLINIRTMAGV